MIDDKLWGIKNFTSKAKKKVDSKDWPKEVRSCRICGRMAEAVIHPDAYQEWREHGNEDDAEKYLGVKVVKMALKGLCCDNCGTTRELYLNSKEGMQAIAVELMRVTEDGVSNLTEKQEVGLMANLRKHMKNYCDALRRMNGSASIIFDEMFVTMVWERPHGCWRTLRAMQLFLYQNKPVRDQYADMTNWLKRMGSAV